MQIEGEGKTVFILRNKNTNRFTVMENQRLLLASDD